MNQRVDHNASPNKANRLPLSVCTITLNEEANIRRLLASVSDFAGEIVIVDSGSTDNTLRIAEEYGARIFTNQWPGYPRQKQFALDHCTHDWCLSLDADEEITQEMAARLPQLLQDTEVAAYRFGRDDCFAGGIPPAGVHARGHTRLFRKSRCRFDTSRTVHEGVIVDGTTKSVDTVFMHYGYDDLSTHNEKNNKYSSLKAKEKALKQPRPSWLRLVFSGPVKFLQSYVIHRNFLWGWRGFVQSSSTAYYSFSVEAKRFELAARARAGNSEIRTGQDT